MTKRRREVPAMTIDGKTQLEIEAATFKRLLNHLDEHKEVQNIELIILGLLVSCRYRIT